MRRIGQHIAHGGATPQHRAEIQKMGVGRLCLFRVAFWQGGDGDGNRRQRADSGEGEDPVPVHGLSHDAGKIIGNGRADAEAGCVEGDGAALVLVASHGPQMIA